jgi:exosome complex component RRP40
MASELVFPGETVPAKHVNLKLGPGLLQQANLSNPSESSVTSTKAGLLQHSANRSKWWVDSNARRVRLRFFQTLASKAYFLSF